MELLIVVTLDRVAAMKLLAATCPLHSFIAERVGPYIIGDWVGLEKGGRDQFCPETAPWWCLLVVVVSAPAWVGHWVHCPCIS